MLNAAGLGERACGAEGQIHAGIELRFHGHGHRIDFPSLTGGRQITVYGQQEAVKDIIAARLAAGGIIHFEVERRRGPRPRQRRRRASPSPATASGMKFAATSSPAATASTASAGRRSPMAFSPFSTASIPSPGSASCRESDPASRRADLHPHRRGLRAAVDALADAAAPLSPGRARRGHRRLVGRPHLGGTAEAHGAGRRRLSHPGRADPAEGHHAHALASSPSRCSSAGCIWRAIPPISCRRPAPRA